MVQLIPVHPKTPSCLASFKSRLVLPFWCLLTQVVLLSSSCSSSISSIRSVEKPAPSVHRESFLQQLEKQVKRNWLLEMKLAFQLVYVIIIIINRFV